VPINGFGFSTLLGDLVATAQDDGSVTFLDLTTKKPTYSFREHQGPAKALCFSQVSKLLLISVGLDKQIVFYDV